jgi:signal transduction histidine kinase
MPLLPLEAGVVRGVVFNLITNALHACDAGAQIALDASFDTHSQELSIEVRDSGAGMPPSVRERCTELFYTTKKKGSGIGLALTHGAVQSAGGRLDIDSAPGRGTRIRLTIPVPDAGGTDARRYETKSGLRRAVSTTEPGVSNVAHR